MVCFKRVPAVQYGLTIAFYFAILFVMMLPKLPSVVLTAVDDVRQALGLHSGHKPKTSYRSQCTCVAQIAKRGRIRRSEVDCHDRFAICERKTRERFPRKTAAIGIALGRTKAMARSLLDPLQQREPSRRRVALLIRGACVALLSSASTCL